MGLNGGAGPSWGRLLGLAAVAGLVAGLATTGLDRALEHRTQEGIGRAYLIATAADLRRDRDAIAHGVDSTTAQIRMAELILAWHEHRQTSGSANLVMGMKEIRTRPPVPFITNSYDDLAFTGRAAWIPAPRIREAVVAYYRSVASLPDAGSLQLEDYRRWMDTQLPPGMWLEQVGRPEPGAYPVEYVTTLEDLEKAGLRVPLRAALQGLHAYRDRLVELQAANTALVEAIESALSP